MSFGNWLSNVGGGAATGAAIGSRTGTWQGGVIGGVIGAGLGAFGASEADKNEKEAEEWRNNQDPTTPYRVKLPSGATITMYAHGKPGPAPKPNLSAHAALQTAQAAGQLYAGAKGATNTIAAPDKLTMPAETGGKLGVANFGDMFKNTTADAQGAGILDSEAINRDYASEYLDLDDTNFMLGRKRR